MKRRRHGPTGSNYNSRKYHAMHKASISAGLRRYWFARKAREAYARGTATPEQLAFVRAEREAAALTALACAALILLASLSIA